MAQASGKEKFRKLMDAAGFGELCEVVLEAIESEKSKVTEQSPKDLITETYTYDVVLHGKVTGTEKQHTSQDFIVESLMDGWSEGDTEVLPPDSKPEPLREMVIGSQYYPYIHLVDETNEPLCNVEFDILRSVNTLAGRPNSGHCSACAKVQSP